MINYELIERNINKILNLGIIILALVIAFKIYESANNQIGALIQQQTNELEKNKVVEEISFLEKKSELYKKWFVKKDLASIMDSISGIAKDATVKIFSIKPLSEGNADNQLSSAFFITLNAPSYHALGNFISKIESHKDIYLVSEISIISKTFDSNASGAIVNLGVNLKINTISYL